jgi:hypothetical protein
LIAETIIILFVALFFAVLFGHGENRYWTDRGPNTRNAVFQLTTYHVWMLVFFCTINSALAVGLSSSWVLRGCLFVWLLFWDVLILDVTWWVERHIDITYLHYDIYDERRGYSWHRVTDFDNAGGFPLVKIGRFQCYAWWIIFAGVLVALGGVILFFL